MDLTRTTALEPSPPTNKDVIEQHWEATCEESKLSEVDKQLFWRGQFLNPSSVIE